MFRWWHGKGEPQWAVPVDVLESGQGLRENSEGGVSRGLPVFPLLYLRVCVVMPVGLGKPFMYLI